MLPCSPYVCEGVQLPLDFVLSPYFLFLPFFVASELQAVLPGETQRVSTVNTSPIAVLCRKESTILLYLCLQCTLSFSTIGGKHSTLRTGTNIGCERVAERGTLPKRKRSFFIAFKVLYRTQRKKAQRVQTVPRVGRLRGTEAGTRPGQFQPFQISVSSMEGGHHWFRNNCQYHQTRIILAFNGTFPAWLYSLDLSIPLGEPSPSFHFHTRGLQRHRCGCLVLLGSQECFCEVFSPAPYI